jgi:2-polyprenyl-3-methyl-5-hydroxy-6-metoxy-1,4-benzoquinol methylase
MKNANINDSFELVYSKAIKDVLNAMPSDLSALAKHNKGWDSGRFDPRKYLSDSKIRYVKALNLIKKNNSKRILDVGGFLGAFPLAMSRLGYDVTIAEKFSYYDQVLDDVAELLKSNGVKIVDVDFTELVNNFDMLPTKYDCVTCMAVAEHLANTPRFLLENINASLRPNGILVFEVPNLAFWPRRLSFFIKGTTVLSPIEDLYHSAIPFTGHHREYTFNDARYVIHEAGLQIISEESFNYSIKMTNLIEIIKYFPAIFLKEFAEILMFECQKK